MYGIITCSLVNQFTNQWLKLRTLLSKIDMFSRIHLESFCGSDTFRNISNISALMVMPLGFDVSGLFDSMSRRTLGMH